MKQAFFCFILLTICYTALFADTQTPEKFLRVIEPAANVRKEPIDASREYINDDLQETQVLYNEILCYKDESGDWYFIEAIEQQEFSHNNLWQGYPGWIRKKSVKFINDAHQYRIYPDINRREGGTFMQSATRSEDAGVAKGALRQGRATQLQEAEMSSLPTRDIGIGSNTVVKNKTAEILSSAGSGAKALFVVSLGTRFWVTGEAKGYYQVDLGDNQAGWVKKKDCLKTDESLNERRLRRNIVRTAKLFLKVPYLWGGRTMFIPRLKEIAAGVDCSGLTNLVYRANNIDIPRDAHEQWMKSEKISPADLKAGDLIFISAKNNSQKITHVMLYIKGECFIEASGTGNVVKIKTFKEKFGAPLPGLVKQDFITDNKKIYFGNLLKDQTSH